MPDRKKIKDIKNLAKILSAQRKGNKTIVHSDGIFDILHIGHIRHLEQAKGLGDILIVTITPDRFVNRGPGRPVFTETLRAEAIASLNCVDYVAINSSPTIEDTLRILKPNIFVQGSEYKNPAPEAANEIANQIKALQDIGATIAFTEDIAFSSTSLINRYLSNLPDEMHEYLTLFRQRYDQKEIEQLIDQFEDMNVLVIGDTILDEYQYCEAIGKSSKDPVLALKYQSHDLFAGGVLAVANHVANFVKNVHLVTVLGEKDDYEAFIRSQLQSNINPYFIKQDNAATIIKRRFIEGYSLNKLFEIYVMDDSGLTPEKDKQLCKYLKDHVSEYDLVIAADFGHGAISLEAVHALADSAPFLAINTQANAGNRGFHTVSRYPRADYVCIAEHEIRLEKRTLNGDLRPMMKDISKRLDSTRMVVTRGRKGALVWNNRGEFVEIPSFAHNIVDRVGAGDAFFAVTSLAAAKGVPDEILGFIGNVVGSLAVEIVGNKKSIDKTSTKKYIASLMR
ncbi:MAG: PfkB family carbohydrate kinase [Syntrophales bacterium]